MALLKANSESGVPVNSLSSANTGRAQSLAKLWRLPGLEFCGESSRLSNCRASR